MSRYCIFLIITFIQGCRTFRSPLPFAKLLTYPYYWRRNLIKCVQNRSQCLVLFPPGSLLCATVYCTSQCLVLFPPGSLLCATVFSPCQGPCYVPQCTVQANTLLCATVYCTSQYLVLSLPGSLLCATVYCTSQYLVLSLPGFLLRATVYCTSSYQHGCSMGCCLMSRESSS